MKITNVYIHIDGEGVDSSCFVCYYFDLQMSKPGVQSRSRVGLHGMNGRRLID